ncbi:creatinine amidohydrolase [Nitrosopumilus zosterae]|uniref:Creatinine amidohydrolase n=1 Tax=Nitrosopumilus zosterae TaxID=718286 RepID=A0A2S2KTU0_9ARCH|nr:creatininase family protein [Nitrosopumilus zosterae]BDQ31714.1 creatininase family protein [Nitrosopumilus zosterae]GBH35062.1 creatinine amidohydrolase [Nitrosopumilus zosterae]
MTDIKSQLDPDLRKLISKNKQVAIIPVGSIEQHGSHLPISTDTDIVTEVAKRISEKNRYLLLPTITFGVSFEHAPFFNLSIRESTLRTVLSDLCISLLSNRIKTVFIINGHHGNLKPIKNIDIRLKKLSKNKLKVFPLSYWHFMNREFDHAGFVETSLMLAISKNVKMKLAKKGLTTDKMTKQQIQKLGKLANKSFPKATKNGIWGDPTKATKKDGQRILDEIINNLSKRCQTCLTGHSS